MLSCHASYPSFKAMFTACVIVVYDLTNRTFASSLSVSQNWRILLQHYMYLFFTDCSYDFQRSKIAMFPRYHKCYFFIFSGVRLFICSKAQLTLLGTEMDYVEDKLSSGFVFNNPNIKGTCGCGESFHV